VIEAQLQPHVAHNRVYMPVEINLKNYRQCIAAIYNAIQAYPREPIEVDFAITEAAMASGMVPIVCWVHDARRRGIDFDILGPTAPRLASVFQRCHWSDFLNGNENRNREPLLSGGMPLLHVENEAGVLSAVDDVVETILRAVRKLGRGSIQALEWSLNEIIDNVFTHSQAETGGFIQTTIFPRRRVVDFVVCDHGVGIPKSMTRIGIREPAEAMIKSVKEGITSRIGENKGNGLYGTLSIARHSRTGHFNLDSSNQRLYWDRIREAAFVKSEGVYFPGTVVHWSVGVDDPDLIEKALVFEGKKYEIAFDYLDKKFSSDDDDKHHLKVFDYRIDTITRIGGKRFRVLVENLLNDGTDQPVEVSFSGMSVISSSFADEVFAKIAQDYGEQFFRERLLISNANETIRGIIAREIEMRVL
jgi:hypothetical protein